MKIGRYAMIMLAMVIAGWLVYRFTRPSAAEMPVSEDTQESTLSEPLSIKRKAQCSLGVTASPASTFNATLSTTNPAPTNAVVLRHLAVAEDEPAEVTPVEDTGVRPSAPAWFLKGAAPVARTGQPPAELVRTNLPEKKPAQNRPYTGP